MVVSNKSSGVGSLRNSLRRADDFEPINKRFKNGLRVFSNRKEVVVRDFDGFFTFGVSSFGGSDVFWDVSELDNVPVLFRRVWSDGVLVDSLTTNEFFEEVVI